MSKKDEKTRVALSFRKRLRRKHAQRTGQAVDFKNGVLVYAGTETPVKTRGGKEIHIPKDLHNK